jgi:hypothetical protein
MASNGINSLKIDCFAALAMTVLFRLKCAPALWIYSQ